MATNVTYNGVTYSVPQNGNSGWGTQLTAYLVALASGSITKAGGVVTLTANLDLGANYGIKSIFFSDRGTAASSGIFRLSNNTAVSWRNAANDGNLDLTVNSSNVLMFNSLPVAALALGAANTVLKMNSGGTAFEYGTLVNANINASAAIAYSKLAALTSANILVGSAGNVATSVAMTGDVTISNAGVTAIASGVIVNADISASAAIDGSKIVAATGSVAGVVTTGAQTIAGTKTLTDLAGTGDRLVQASSTGVLSASLGVSSGTYTPTITGVTNYASSSNVFANYIRIGEICYVSVTATVAVTAAAPTLTTFRCSLPISTDITSLYYLIGSGTQYSTTTVMVPVYVVGDGTNEEAEVHMWSTTTAARQCKFTFSYRIA